MNPNPQPTGLRIRARLFMVLVFYPLSLVWLVLVGYGSLLFSLGQVFGWLRSGVWVSLPAWYLFTDPLVSAGASLEIAADALSMIPSWFRYPDWWLVEPHDWLGVHKVVASLLDLLSVPGVAIIIGFVVLASTLWLHSKFEQAFGVQLDRY